MAFVRLKWVIFVQFSSNRRCERETKVPQLLVAPPPESCSDASIKNIGREIAFGTASPVLSTLKGIFVLMYYISIENQRKQLKRVGYQADPILFDLNGIECRDTSRDDSITYVIRK